MRVCTKTATAPPDRPPRTRTRTRTAKAHATRTPRPRMPRKSCVWFFWTHDPYSQSPVRISRLSLLLRLAGSAACILLMLLLLACLLVRPISRRYIFRGASSARATVAAAPAKNEGDMMMEECTTTARDGVRVHMLSLDAVDLDLGAYASANVNAPRRRTTTTTTTMTTTSKTKTKTVVVLFHNNRETAEQQGDIARLLSQRGLSVLIVEYRGYGVSSDAGAAPTEDGLYLDAEAALEYLRVERDVSDPNRIVLMGTSLGSGVAAEMAARGRGSRLVLLSPYTSIPDLVTNVVPIVPATLLLGDHFNTLAKARAIQIPTLIVHGDADEIVPFVMGEKLATAIARARLLPIAGGHHGDLFLRRGDGLVDDIVAFIRHS
jgi:uncharacterized protein